MFIIQTDLSPSEAMQHIQSYMTSQNKGWTLTHKDQDSITFTRTGKPNILATIILLLLWVLPGILYLIFAWRKETANFFVAQRKDCTAITVEAGQRTPIIGRAITKRLGKASDHVEVTKNDGQYGLLIFAGASILLLLVVLVALMFPAFGATFVWIVFHWYIWLAAGALWWILYRSKFTDVNRKRISIGVASVALIAWGIQDIGALLNNRMQPQPVVSAPVVTDTKPVQQQVQLEHRILSDTVEADSPLKTQVELVVLVPATAKESELRTLLSSLYQQVSNRRGYKHHSRPTHIAIFIYTSEEKWKAGWGQWVGMVRRVGNDGEVKIEVKLENA